jgi:flagellar biosynthesis repressor protein FlbT
MSLTVELKPGERIIIGRSLLTNGPHRARINIEGDEPVLRERDILTTERADTPAKRIYLAVQLMYLRGTTSDLHKPYFELVQNIVEAAPSTRPHIDRMNNHLLTGSLYKALKEAKALVAYEGGIFRDAERGSRLPTGSAKDSNAT